MMPMIQTTTGQVDVDDGTLFYQIAGTGETVVLSHAAFLDSRMFDALWEPLTQHYRVIRYDMCGFGQSSPAQGPRCRRDDLTRLLSHLGVTRAHFVGCSNGGELMLDLALEQPSLVASLTLVNSTPSGFQMQGEPPRYVLEMFAASQAGEVARANELQIRIWLDGMFREPDQVDTALRAKALLMNRIPVERQTFFVADMQPLRPLDPPAVTRLREVQQPVWVVVGALDHPEILRAADVMSAALPNARQMILPDTGHVPSYEQPETFGALLLDFLRA